MLSKALWQKRRESMSAGKKVEKMLDKYELDELLDASSMMKISWMIQSVKTLLRYLRTSRRITVRTGHDSVPL